ncbi:hypothetical protein JCGZ_01783 [Jatropha curcas]|uniref:Aminotransferase-like plant mobile domain-containing protein n=1 Tax=Jatropha curcas TaxID=180498 RepID=A0A067JJF7_JATCU|nr:hypothetical protein JCGZ_01783 [Jatropha curcas]
MWARVLWPRFRSRYSINITQLERLSVRLIWAILGILTWVRAATRSYWAPWSRDGGTPPILSTFLGAWKEKFNPSILRSLENMAHLEEYDWAGAILSRMYDDMCDLSRGHCKLSGTYYFWEAEIGSLTARLQSWIQADPDFQQSDALSRRRVVLSHPVLQRYYLGKRVDIQIRGCRSVPYSPPKDMRAGKQMTLTAAHTEGIPQVEFIMGGDYDEFCRISLM